MAQDALDHDAVINGRDDPRLSRSTGTQERIGFPHLFDEFERLGGQGAARVVLGHVDDLNGLPRAIGLSRGAFVSLAATMIAETTGSSARQACVRTKGTLRCA